MGKCTFEGPIGLYRGFPSPYSQYSAYFELIELHRILRPIKSTVMGELNLEHTRQINHHYSIELCPGGEERDALYRRSRRRRTVSQSPW